MIFARSVGTLRFPLPIWVGPAGCTTPPHFPCGASVLMPSYFAFAGILLFMRPALAICEGCACWCTRPLPVGRLSRMSWLLIFDPSVGEKTGEILARYWLD